MNRYLAIIFLIAICCASHVNAQGFKAYFACGLNLTEAYLTNSGDSQVGTRIGLNLGSGVSLITNKKWDLSMEFLYSQNGHYVKFVQTPVIPLDKIMLHYLEVPFKIAYHFNIQGNKKTPFNHHSINGGLSLAHLFKYNITAIDGSDLTKDIRFNQENAILLNFGATSYINDTFAINGKGSISTFGAWTMALRLLYYV